MTRIWIGDARCEQLHYWWEQQKKKEEEERQKKLEEEEKTGKVDKDSTENLETGVKIEHHYITENSATFEWFRDTAIEQMLAAGSSNVEVIFMPGLYDCIHSCRLGHMLEQNVNKLTKDIAQHYYELVNELVEKYQSVKFYFCSVNPIAAVFPDVCAKKGYFSVEEINSLVVP